MEENNKKNKGLIVIIVILILLVLGLGGYIAYDKVLKEEPKEVETPKEEVTLEPDFYSVSELVKNKYIEKIDDTVNKGDKVIEIRDGKVYVVDDLYDMETTKLIAAKGIEGTPKYVYFSAEQAMSLSMFVVLTEEGDLYYAKPLVEENDESLLVSNFSKVTNEKVKDIYTIADFYSNYVTYPVEYVSIYFETESNELINLHLGEVGKTFEENWPYPDVVYGCGQCSDYECANGLYIAPDKKIYNRIVDDNKNKTYNVIKYNNQELVVKDVFVSCGYSDTENGEFESNYYIVGEDNYIYKVNSINSDIKSVDKYKELKTNSFKYDFRENDEGREIVAIIEYENGEKEKVSNIGLVSTLYYRYNK